MLASRYKITRFNAVINAVNITKRDPRSIRGEKDGLIITCLGIHLFEPCLAVVHVPTLVLRHFRPFVIDRVSIEGVKLFFSLELMLNH